MRILHVYLRPVGYILLAAILLTTSMTQPISAIGKYTPSQDSDTYGYTPRGLGSDFGNGAAVHVMRLHRSGSIKQLTFTALFTSTGTKSFKVGTAWGSTPSSSKVGYRACDVGNGDVGSSNRLRVQIEISGSSLAMNSGNPSVNPRLCDVIGNVYAFTIPPSATMDEGSGRYRVNITMRLNGGKSSHDDDWYRNNGVEANLYFVGVVSGSNSLIGPAQSNARNAYGLVGKRTGYSGGPADRDFGIQYRTPFGLPCNESDGRDLRVTFWDPDPATFGDTSIWVEQQARSGGGWSKLTRSQYIDDSTNATWVSGSSNRYWETTRGSGSRSSVAVKGATKAYNYRLVVQNKTRGVTNGPNADVVSVSVPRDAVYGAIGCDYELSPEMNDIQSSVDPGQSLKVSGIITKSGPLPQSDLAQMTLTEVRYSSSKSWAEIQDAQVGDGDGNSSGTPCQTVATQSQLGDRVYCSYPINLDGAARERISSSKTLSADWIAPASIGTRVCFVISVKSPVNSSQVTTDNTWRHSAMQCTIVAKHPKIQVLGSDLKVLGQIGAYRSNDIDGRNFGSWVEYGIFAVGQNGEAGSGTIARGGQPGAYSKDDWNRLTFANTGSRAGNFGTGSISPSDASDYFEGLSASGGAFDPSNPQSGVYDLGPSATFDEDINLSQGKSVILRSSGTVRINGNITVPPSYTNVKDISQVVIVAPAIIIGDTVANVDAWLLATNGTSGKISTCGNRELATAALTTGVCNQSLAVNGAVVTDRLHLLRTAGAGTGVDAANPAEIFRLRPDSLIWAYNYTNRTSRAQTTYVKELPPRY